MEVWYRGECVYPHAGFGLMLFMYRWMINTVGEGGFNGWNSLFLSYNLMFWNLGSFYKFICSSHIPYILMYSLIWNENRWYERLSLNFRADTNVNRILSSAHLWVRLTLAYGNGHHSYILCSNWGPAVTPTDFREFRLFCRIDKWQDMAGAWNPQFPMIRLRGLHESMII